MVRHMYYSAYHFGDACKPRLHTKALRERFTSNKQQAQGKLYLYHWISKRIHLGNPLLESQQFFEGAICPAVGDYTGRYNVLYYDPDSGEKAVLNGNIEGIKITVTD